MLFVLSQRVDRVETWANRLEITPHWVLVRKISNSKGVRVEAYQYLDSLHPVYPREVQIPRP